MNMSYCRFQNTSNDVSDCLNALNDMNEGAEEKLSRDERGAAHRLLAQAVSMVDSIREVLHMSEDDEITADTINEYLDELEKNAKGEEDENEG